MPSHMWALIFYRVFLFNWLEFVPSVSRSVRTSLASTFFHLPGIHDLYFPVYFSSCFFFEPVYPPSLLSLNFANFFLKSRGQHSSLFSSWTAFFCWGVGRLSPGYLAELSIGFLPFVPRVSAGDPFPPSGFQRVLFGFAFSLQFLFVQSFFSFCLVRAIRVFGCSLAPDFVFH